MNNYIKKITFIFSFLLSVCLLSAQSSARLITANPGENASTEVRISWHTDLRVENSFVKFTTTDDTDWANARTVQGESITSTTWYGVPTRIRKDGEINRIFQDYVVKRHTATLSELTPDTDYMYRIGYSNVFSDARYFRTAGASEFTFAWISDFHLWQPLPERLNHGMNMISTLIEQAPNGVDFIFSTGDVLSFGGCYGEWKTLFNQSHLRNHIWVSLIGNHDLYQDGRITPEYHKQKFFTETHNFPPNGYAGQEGASYWFTYGNVLWIVLNSMDLRNEEQVPIAQAWAEEVIRNNTAQYIFFAQHFQWFNADGAPNRPGFTRWHEFFDEWGVDIAFSGNSHVYFRTYPLYNRQVSHDPSRGTVYIGAPSSDGGRGRDKENMTAENAKKTAMRWTEGDNTVGGSLVTVNEREVTISLYNRYGDRIDNVVIPARR